MKIQKTTLKTIAELIGAKYVGPANFPVTGLNEIHKVEAGDITFVDHPKYYAKALNSAASVVLINKEVVCPEGKALLLHDDPFDAFLRIMRHFRPFEPQTQPISDSATIGEGTQIMPGTFVGHHTIIGKNCLIHPNVTIYDHCVIGDNVIIHSGSVIGADGYYFQRRNEGFKKFESFGRVVIADDVEIGALCSIDRGVTSDTIIESGAVCASTRTWSSAQARWYWPPPLSTKTSSRVRPSSVCQHKRCGNNGANRPPCVSCLIF